MKSVQKSVMLLEYNVAKTLTCAGILSGVMTQKKRLKAQHTAHDIFLFLRDAVRVVVCNILSLLH